MASSFQRNVVPPVSTWQLNDMFLFWASVVTTTNNLEALQGCYHNLGIAIVNSLIVLSKKCFVLSSKDRWSLQYAA